MRAKTSRRACGLCRFFSAIFTACFCVGRAPAAKIDQDEVIAPRNSSPRGSRPVPVLPLEAESAHGTSGSSPRTPTAPTTSPATPATNTTTETTPAPNLSATPASTTNAEADESKKASPSLETSVSSPDPPSPLPTTSATATAETTTETPTKTPAPGLLSASTPSTTSIQTQKAGSPCPPGLSPEKHSPSQVAIAFAAHEKDLDTGLATTDCDAPPGFEHVKPNQNNGDDYMSLLPVVTSFYHEATLAKKLGCLAYAKKRLEDCTYNLQFVIGHAQNHPGFLAPEAFDDVKLALVKVTAELATLPAASENEKHFVGEELVVADVAFLNNILDGALPLDNDKARSYIADVCAKLVNLIKKMESLVEDGVKEALPDYKFAVAAGAEAADILGKMEVKYAALYSENIAKASAKLFTKVIYAEGKLEMLLEGDGGVENENEISAPVPAHIMRLDSGVSGPTSGDSTPMSNAGGVVSINHAATEVIGKTTRAARTRRGRKNSKRTGTRRS